MKVPHQELEKEDQNKPKSSRKRETVGKKINETKNSSSGKTVKINKFLSKKFGKDKKREDTND